MAKPSTTTTPLSQQTTFSSTTITKDISPQYASKLIAFVESVGASDSSIDKYNYSAKDWYSHLVCGHLKVDLVQRGRVTCLLSVKPPVANYFNALHGGAVAAFAERVSIACARTVVGDDKEIFLGELSMSYLSAAPLNEELIVDGSVVRSGRNLTVIAIEFKVKKTEKLVYTARATFYNMPIAKL